jgi:hypothetical protein
MSVPSLAQNCFFALKQQRTYKNLLMPELTFYAQHFVKHNSVLQID